MHTPYEEITKRRPVNLTIRQDVLAEAKGLNLNASKAAEAGIIEAVKKAREESWLKENKDSIKAHNERLEKEGLLLNPYWLSD